MNAIATVSQRWQSELRDERSRFTAIKRRNHIYCQLKYHFLNSIFPVHSVICVILCLSKKSQCCNAKLARIVQTISGAIAIYSSQMLWLRLGRSGMSAQHTTGSSRVVFHFTASGLWTTTTTAAVWRWMASGRMKLAKEEQNADGNSRQ